MINVRTFVAAATVLALCVRLDSAQPANGATIAHTLRIGFEEEPASLNPLLTAQAAVIYLGQMTAAYAFRFDGRNRLVPELAAVVPTEQNGGISKDGKTIRLKLRSGLRWSDGAPLDADDVAFSISAINNPANNVESRQGFDRIVNVEEPDKHTVVLHLREPYGAIVATLFASNSQPIILPKHLLGGLHDINTAPFNALPIGAGPFRFTSWRHGERIEMERNPYYWRGRATLDRIVLPLIPDRNTMLTQLQTGEIDLWFPFGGVYLSRVQAIPNVHVIRTGSYIMNEMLLNVTSPLLADAAVRRALRYGIDRRFLHDKVSHGVGSLQNVVVSTVDPSTPKNIPFTPFDPAKANALLDAAGWQRAPDGVRAKNGRRLALTFASTIGSPDVDIQIETVRATLKTIGVEMNVLRYTSPLLFGPGGIMESGKFDVTLLGNEIPAPFDLTLNFGCHSVPPHGLNYARYCNAKVDAILERYDRTYDEAARTRFLADVLATVDADVPAIVIIGREDLFGVNDAVTQFRPNAATPFDDLLHVDVK